MSKLIKLFDPVIDSSEKKALVKVLDSKFWASGSGSGYVSKFENEFKKQKPSEGNTYYIIHPVLKHIALLCCQKK